MEYKLTAPLSKADAAKLRAGDTVLLSGTIYTARDAAHKRLCALAAEGKLCPLPLRTRSFITPAPRPPAGRWCDRFRGPPPATYGRYAPTLLDMGQTA
jgi:fumarate hydratase subunit beta